jgi:uroporphyrinogen-III decarboxylase
MLIKGNIDSVNTLLNDNDDVIRQDLLTRIQTGMSYRGFILSTACSIAPGVKAERVRMITQMAKKYGVY